MGLAVPAATAAGGPRVEQAASGPYLIEVSYVIDGYFVHQPVSVAVRRGAHVIFRERVRCRNCAPGAAAGEPVRWVSLRTGSAPEAVLGIYSGGAHCCYLTRIYDPGPRGVAVLTHDWGNAGAKVVDLNGDGVDEFVSGDDHFAYAFTDYAGSALPLQVLALRGGSLVDVTGRFTGTLRADAAKLWSGYLRDRLDTRGVLAAWAADEARLGRWPQALAQLEQLRARGRLALPAGAFAGDLGGRSPAYFIASLHRFLAARGYLAR
jgi:hypothetical protein